MIQLIHSQNHDLNTDDEDYISLILEEVEFFSYKKLKLWSISLSEMRYGTEDGELMIDNKTWELVELIRN